MRSRWDWLIIGLFSVWALGWAAGCPQRDKTIVDKHEQTLAEED